MKDYYRAIIWDLVGNDPVVNLFFYDPEDVERMTFTGLFEEFEKPWILHEADENGIARCTIYVLEEAWKTESGT